METFAGWSEQDTKTAFKSYYVVWKLKKYKTTRENKKSLNRTMQYGNSQAMRSGRQTLEVFKSYYVVWKPFSCVYNNNKIFQFKSYYVVWKRIAEEYIFPQPIHV